MARTPSRSPSPRSCAREAWRPGSGLDRVAEVERGVGLRRSEEAGVDALERGAVAVVGALDGRLAAADGHAGHLHPAESVAGSLRLLEDLDVDLHAEALVHAAQEAMPGLLVVVEVEVGAVGCQASRRMHHAGAERAARAAPARGDC